MRPNCKKERAVHVRKILKGTIQSSGGNVSYLLFMGKNKSPADGYKDLHSFSGCTIMQPRAIIENLREGQYGAVCGRRNALHAETAAGYKDKWEAICPENGTHKLLWMIGEVGEVIDIV